MIEARNLKKVYKMKKGVIVKALDDVSVKLPDTGMVFILGKSGSGKSTLLNVLGGLDSIDSGEIIIKGTSAKDFKQSHYDSYRNTYIGFIFQEYNVLEELTVGANVALAIELQGRKATDEEINSILKEVDLEGYGNRKPNELSGGQKQRVAIARALVKKPEIIMADEPTGALDSTTGKQVFDTLKKLSKDKLVLIVSHDREFSEQYADRIIELKDGVIISDVEKEGSEYADFTEAEADDSITYGDGEIAIKPGYTLTEEDRVAINEYLTALQSGAKIKVGETKLKKKFSAKDFVPTDESRIVSHKKGDFKLIKSKLSLKNAFKLGSGGLKHKKVRLVFTIFLSLISFTLFGLADTIAAYNSVNTATQSIYDTGVNYASYIKSVQRGSDYKYWSDGNNYITLEELANIEAETGIDVVGVYKKNESLSLEQNLGDEEVEGKNLDQLYSSELSGITAIDNALMTSNGFELMAGRLPTAGNEIALTKFTYDYFEKVGYKTYDDGEKKFEINSPQDLVGKKLSFNFTYNGKNEYHVVGIVDTKFDYSSYEPLADENAQFLLSTIEMMMLTSELEAASKYSFASVCFVSPKMMEDIVGSQAGKAESIGNGGNLQFYIVKNDNIDTDKGIWGEEGSNVISSFYFSYINSLDRIDTADIIWLSDNRPTTLADNQILLSLDRAIDLMGQIAQPDVWYNEEKVQSADKQLQEQFEAIGLNSYYFSNLQSLFSNTNEIVTGKYAIENTAQAETYLKAFLKEAWNWSDEEIANNLSETNSIIGWFCNNISEIERIAGKKIITDDMKNAYTNDLIERYSLGEYKLSSAIRDKLVTNKTYINPNNFLFTFQMDPWNFNYTVARSYAAKNIDDAKKFYPYSFENAEDAPQHIDANIAIDTYASYLNGGYSDIDTSGFTPEATETFDEFKADILIEVYKTSSSSGKPMMEVWSNSDYTTNYIKGVEIVGFITGADDIPAGGGDRIVVSDNIVNKLLGVNRGGIYDFAIGTMPTNTSEIHKLVDFAKNHTYHEGTVKFSLKNNVTEQLSMVDEILDILGQVFLYVGLGFALFASVMLANFISTSISHKKQDIGILRAIGSRSGDVFRIFFAESFIIAMINYVLAVAGTLSVTIVINSLLRNEAGLLITFLNFGIRQIGLLLGVSLLVAFIATLFPVKKIASLKPIDAIKNRK